MNDTQKVLNWIGNSTDLSDYTLMTVTILDDNVSERTFRLPELRQVAFNTEIDGDRRKMLGKGVGGLIKQWSKDSALVPGGHPPFSVMAFRTAGIDNRIYEIAEWNESMGWGSWKARAYWIVGVATRSDKLKYVAIIPRHGQFNSPAVRWFQKLEYSPDLVVDVDDENTDEYLDELNMFLELRRTKIPTPDLKFHLARIDFRPLTPLNV